MPKSIKFRASFIQPETYGLAKVKEVEFKLGLGPCGRFVETLTHEVSEGILKITQTSHLTERPYPPYAGREALEFAERTRPRWFGLTGCKAAHKYNLSVYEDIREAIKEWRDGCEIKQFVYKMSDIHGRIEVIQ